MGHSVTGSMFGCIYRVLGRRPNRSTKEKLHFLLASQYWSLERLLYYQWNKLVRLVDYSYKNVPYYERIMKDAGIVPEDIRSHEDFQCLPILNKAQIQENFTHLLSRKASRDMLVFNSTGGSTGMPLNFYQDANYKEWADSARIRAWKHFCGIDDYQGAIEAVLWGAVRDIGKGLDYGKILRSIVRDGWFSVNTFDLDMDLMKRFIRLYNVIKPPIVRGYASSLFFLSEHMADIGIRELHAPLAVISSTEVLWPRMRKKIESCFRSKVYDSYGCREVSQIATECSVHDGFHVVMENQYVELIGNRIIVTNLNNFAFPFIRYEVGDLAGELCYDSCTCGRRSIRLRNLLGRDNDNIKLANGKIINGEFFEFLFFGYTSVERYQVIYLSRRKRIQILLKLRFHGENVVEAIRKKMLDCYGVSDIEVILTDTFRSTPTGKFRFVFAADE